jgi:SAM-dependent methyltransferase
MTSRPDAQCFDLLAADYDRIEELTGSSPFDYMLQELLPASGLRALDLGCGTGRHAAVLAQRFDQVDAVDLSGEMIKLARTRHPQPNINYRQQNLHDIGGIGQYDFIVCALTLHHTTSLQPTLTHINKLLAPAGKAVIMDIYELSPRSFITLALPLRFRLMATAAKMLLFDTFSRGPKIAWELYRLYTGPWMEHRISDRFFTKGELEDACQGTLLSCEFRPCENRRMLTVIFTGHSQHGERLTEDQIDPSADGNRRI